MQPSLAAVDDRIAEWGVSVEQKRAILLLSCQIHEKVCAGSEKSYETLLQYLRTFEAEGDAASAKDQAGRAIALAISLDTVHEYNELLGLKAVQQVCTQRVGLIDERARRTLGSTRGCGQRENERMSERERERE